MSATAVVDTSALADMLRTRTQEIADDSMQAMLVDMAVDAPRDTGAMTNNITIENADSGATFVRTIRAPDAYGRYQDEGTGPIYPVNAKVLRFVAKDGTVVYAKSTKGVPLTGWWSDKVAKYAEYVRGVLR